MPCFLQTSCACALECERFLLPHSDICFDEHGGGRWFAERDINRLVSRYPMQRIFTDGVGTEIEPRVSVSKQKGVPWLTTTNRCPHHCSNRGLCDTTYMECRCAWFQGGTGCEVSGGAYQCFNDCSGRGACVNGVCHCDEGVFGIDCSLFLHEDGSPGVFERHRFLWAREINPYMQQEASLKIYVYELPPEYNTWQFQHVPVIDLPEAFWFLERLLASAHRTANPEEADFFYVPLILRNRDSAKVALLYDAVEYVKQTWPFWNRRNGADHIFFVNDGWGKCNLGVYGEVDPVIRDSIALTPWGYNFNMLTRTEENGCFRAGRDIAIPPSLQAPLYLNISAVKEAAGEHMPERKILMLFKGWRGLNPEKDDTGHVFSFGVRQKVVDLFGDKEEETGMRILNVDETAMFNEFMEESIFCLSTIGHGFHTSTVIALLAGCIPVVIQPNVTQPFDGDGLDWTKFAVFLSMDDIPQLPQILRAIPPAEVSAKQQMLRVVWASFTWTSPHFKPLQELDRATHGRLTLWLERRDAFATIMHTLARRVSKASEDFMTPPHLPEINL